MSWNWPSDKRQPDTGVHGYRVTRLFATRPNNRVSLGESHESHLCGGWLTDQDQMRYSTRLCCQCDCLLTTDGNINGWAGGGGGRRRNCAGYG